MVETHKTVRVRMTGRVQGVGFRYWTKSEAEALGLTGWVRNEKDGSVAATIAGPESAVALMIERLRTGPAGAKVSEVDVEDAGEGERFDQFRIAR